MGKVIEYKFLLDKLFQIKKPSDKELRIINGLYDWMINEERKKSYNYEVN